MKNFFIKIICKLPHDPQYADQYECVLHIAYKKFNFFPAINIWSIDDYIRQWQEGLQRILTTDTSCIVTDVRDIGEFPLAMVWSLFKDGDMVYCQGKMLHKTTTPISFHEVSFTVENCYQYIGERRPKDALGVFSFRIEPEDFNADVLWKKC